jgi:polyhydroxybutyrate depolymerase
MSPRFAVTICAALAATSLACGSSPNNPPELPLGSLERPDASGLDGGSADTGGAEAGPAVVVKRSAGCGQAPPADGAFGKYVRHDEVVTGVAPAYAADYTNRFYWVRLPVGYDPDHAYPTVFIGPGCGESGEAPIPIQAASKETAILVGLNGAMNCFNHDGVDTPDLPYFDATLAEVEAASCVDTAHVFVTGFSSGSWLANYLGCARGDLLRAQASVAGGLPPIPPTCTGPIPAMFASDTLDMQNPSATVKLALQRVLTVNGCGTTTVPYDFGVPSPCVQYQGCRPGFPVVYCETSSVGHADQSTTQISTVGFWHFWTSLD